jgi:hypothetical protein
MPKIKHYPKFIQNFLDGEIKFIKKHINPNESPNRSKLRGIYPNGNKVRGSFLINGS